LPYAAPLGLRFAKRDLPTAYAVGYGYSVGSANWLLVNSKKRGFASLASISLFQKLGERNPCTVRIDRDGQFDPMFRLLSRRHHESHAFSL
jgi:hypothetical protein